MHNRKNKRNANEISGHTSRFSIRQQSYLMVAISDGDSGGDSTMVVMLTGCCNRFPYMKSHSTAGVKKRGDGDGDRDGDGDGNGDGDGDGDGNGDGDGDRNVMVMEMVMVMVMVMGMEMEMGMGMI